MAGGLLLQQLLQDHNLLKVQVDKLLQAVVAAAAVAMLALSPATEAVAVAAA
jgi:hypothetical protein